MTPARKPVTKPTVAVDVTDEIDPFVGGHVPQNVLDSEGVFLSHCLMHPEQFESLRSMLEPKHFYATCNQRVYEGLLHIYAGYANTDVVLLKNYMSHAGTLKLAGGSPYLALLIDCTPATATPAIHAAQIREAWKQRELMACMTRQAILLRNGQVDYAGAIAALRDLVKMVKE